MQQFITDHFYTCTLEILAGLGEMYVADASVKTLTRLTVRARQILLHRPFVLTAEIDSSLSIAMQILRRLSLHKELA